MGHFSLKAEGLKALLWKNNNLDIHKINYRYRKLVHVHVQVFSFIFLPNQLSCAFNLVNISDLWPLTKYVHTLRSCRSLSFYIFVLLTINAKILHFLNTSHSTHVSGYKRILVWYWNVQKKHRIRNTAGRRTYQCSDALFTTYTSLPRTILHVIYFHGEN